MKTNEKEVLKKKTLAELNEALGKAQEKKFNRREIALLQTLINQKKEQT